MKGNVTVEASYVFPFCFLVIVIVCYLGIFTYNKAVLKITGYECILQAMELRQESEQLLQETILKSAEQTAETRVLGVKDLKAEVKITATKISVIYSGSQSVLCVPIKTTAVYERTYPELTLRLILGNKGDVNEGTIKKGIE